MHSTCHLRTQRPGLLRSLHVRIYKDFRDADEVTAGNSSITGSWTLFIWWSSSFQSQPVGLRDRAPGGRRAWARGGRRHAPWVVGREGRPDSPRRGPWDSSRKAPSFQKGPKGGISSHAGNCPQRLGQRVPGNGSGAG